MVSKKSLVVVAVVVAVAAAGLWMLLGGVKPPVDVYARSTPAISESPIDLLPDSVAGCDCYYDVDISTSDYIGVQGFYRGDFEGEIYITIQRCSSSDVASSTLDEVISQAMDLSGSTVSQQTGEVHWLTHTGSVIGDDEWSIFMWRKGAWIFSVWAPTETLRNQVVEDLSF
jgi:hypothetical protein